MTHYIADVAVFGHVMGSSTPWGNEKHHADYESYVEDRTTTYSSNFNSCLSFDGSLSITSAYDTAINLAYDTTFGGSNRLTCVWMDNNYNWNNPTFENRCGESLNLAVNSITDVLHTLYQQASNLSASLPSQTPSTSINSPHTVNPTATNQEYGTIIIILSALIVAVSVFLAMLTYVQIKMRKTRLEPSRHER